MRPRPQVFIVVLPPEIAPILAQTFLEILVIPSLASDDKTLLIRGLRPDVSHFAHQFFVPHVQAGDPL